MRAEPLRVLLIDDAILFSAAVARELDRSPELHCTTCAGTIDAVRARLIQFHPEVIALDLEARGGDPLVLLRRLRDHYPVPVIVTVRGGSPAARTALRAIEQGAFDVVLRPDAYDRHAVAVHARELLPKLRAAAALARPLAGRVGPNRPQPTWQAAGIDGARWLIVIGASTGGTEAIAGLLAATAADSPPIVIVQHMPLHFTRSFADRLNTGSAVRVSEALDGEVLGVGRAIIARGDTHLTIQKYGEGWRARYTDQKPVNRHCPSVDVLFDSVVPHAARVVGVLLTGMGEDGAAGLLRLRKAGAVTIAQDESSCVVYGMPKAACERGAAQYIVPPEEVPACILRAVRGRERVGVR